LIGGLIGGLVGGALYEPMKHIGSEHLSRLIAIIAIGFIAGIASGIIENVVKTGWVKVIAGMIAGKQFVLYRNPTYIGSSPQSHIYLFKDPESRPTSRRRFTSSPADTKSKTCRSEPKHSSTANPSRGKNFE
jgi:hypothetical protein